MLLKAARSSLILALDGRPDGPALHRAEILAHAAARLEVPLLILAGAPGAAASLAAMGAGTESFAATDVGRQALAARLDGLGRDQLVLAGAAAALDDLAGGALAARPRESLYLIADAIWPRPGARADFEVVTSEMVVFEWLERAGTPAFRDLLPLIK